MNNDMTKLTDDMIHKALVMKGAPAAEALSEKLCKRTEILKEKGVIPALTILRVGESQSDLAYERGAMKRAEKIGVCVKRIVLPEDADEQDILKVISDINEDKNVHGCLMFRPLKSRETEKKAAALLFSSKDADCMTVSSQAALYTGDSGRGFAPCTAEAVIELLKYYHIAVEGKHAVIIGRSQVIGKPAAMLLLNENATVTICHSRTENLRAIVKNADIVVAAAGRSGIIDESFLSQGQIIIDVGINVGADGGICGDVNEEAKKTLAGAYTPVPGGVGSMTSTILIKHVIEAAERTVGI